MASKPSKLGVRSLTLIGLLGGLGGAVNAWHCYSIKAFEFSWPVIPAGFFHGMILAVVSVVGAGLLLRRSWVVRWLGLPVVGWLAGWWAGIALSLYHDLTTLPLPLSADEVMGALVWPLRSSHVWAPYQWFGLVGVVYYSLLNLCQQLTATRLMTHLLMGTISGILGSLWWWTGWAGEPISRLSVIHGTIWGSLVGFGIWKSQQISR